MAGGFPTTGGSNTPLRNVKDYGTGAKGDMASAKTTANGSGKPEDTGSGAGNKPPAGKATTDMRKIAAAADGKGKKG